MIRTYPLILFSPANLNSVNTCINFYSLTWGKFTVILCSMCISITPFPTYINVQREFVFYSNVGIGMEKHKYKELTVNWETWHKKQKRDLWDGTADGRISIRTNKRGNILFSHLYFHGRTFPYPWIVEVVQKSLRMTSPCSAGTLQHFTTCRASGEVGDLK